jgi:tetratricopeptide (TPR) repeat protein
LKRLLAGIALLALLVIVTINQSDMLRHRPTVLKLGPAPNAALLKALVGEHSVPLAFRNVVRVMFYFGSFFEDHLNRIQKVPEYYGMYKHLESSVQLDPYNMDAYYFSQAAFTWELGRVKEVNQLLDYGMKHRTWDYWLPFYAGFNSAYFLKDYATAAGYMKKAAEISGNSLFTTLAARYFHEAGESDLGLVFLESMARDTQRPEVKAIYEKRITALQGVRAIESAIGAFRVVHKNSPLSLPILVQEGFLQEVPRDPYGGEFYLSEDGKVLSTSKFTLSQESAGPSVEETIRISPGEEDLD